MFGNPEVAKYIKMVVKHFFPDEYPILDDVYNKVNWVSEELPMYTKDGIFVGQILLWKLQTALHRDPRDFICAIFCAGDFKGGELLILDLMLKLRYIFFFTLCKTFLR